jgi:hypothetical protein
MNTIALAVALIPAIASAQRRPRLHVNPRWKECSIQLDSSLTQSAWRQFTEEAAQVLYFRPLADARPMGRGKFEFAFMQWQTNVDDRDAAWNDTFVHPDSLHWLFEGSGLQFPGLAFRAGLTSTSDVGFYFTRNIQANYGAYGAQVQQHLVRFAGEWDLSARASFVSLFGPEDVDLKVYGGDMVASWKGWTYARASLVPYAAVATYVAQAHQKSTVVTLADERALGVMATVGAQLQYAAVRIGWEASFARVPSVSMKFSVGR